MPYNCTAHTVWWLPQKDREKKRRKKEWKTEINAHRNEKQRKIGEREKRTEAERRKEKQRNRETDRERKEEKRKKR